MTFEFESTEQTFTAGFAEQIGIISQDYETLANKPKINGVELVGDTSLTTLGAATASDLTAEAAARAAADDALDARLDTIEGKEAGWDAKQEALVSGTNIKTINDKTLLGSGNVTLDGANINVDDSVATPQTIKAALASASTEIANKADASALTAHTSSTSNPHSVTKAQVGLGNCDNTSDAKKPISTATQTALNAKLDKANPTGTGSFSLNRKAGTTTGVFSVAEGYNATASGAYSHAEGGATVASGVGAHAEGQSTTASEITSHAEGSSTTASASASHAEGYGTKASSANQHVQGKYNVEDSSSTYADIVGWGSSDSARKNISALTTGGTLKLSGDLYTGCSDDSTGGTALSTALNAKANTADLATVATSGSYNDLSDTPTIPSEAQDIYFDADVRGVLDVTDVQSAIDETTDIIASAYDSTSAYAVGDYCLHASGMYRCTTAIASGGEAWTAAHWTEVKVGTELASQSAQIANKQAQNIQRTVTIAVADWNSGTTCTKTVSGVTASNTVIVDPSDATVSATAQGTDSLTFTATATPTADVTVKVVILP